MIRRVCNAVRRRKQEQDSSPDKAKATTPLDDTTRLESFVRSLPKVRCTRINVHVYGRENTGRSCFLGRLIGAPYPMQYDPCGNGTYVVTNELSWRLGRYMTVIFSPTHLDYVLESPSLGPQFNDLNFYIITYNVGDRQTFDSLDELHHQVQTRKDRLGRIVQWRGGLVVALACDLSDEPGAVSLREGQQFAREKQLPFHETSAKTEYGCARNDSDKIVHPLLLQAAS